MPKDRYRPKTYGEAMSKDTRFCAATKKMFSR